MSDLTRDDKPAFSSVAVAREMFQLVLPHHHLCSCEDDEWLGSNTSMYACSKEFPFITNFDKIWQDLEWDPTIEF